MKMSMELLWNDTERGKANTRIKSRPSTNLFTTYITWTDLELNPGFHSDRPATGYLIHGTGHTWTDIRLTYIQRFESHLTVHTLLLRYRDQPAKAVHVF